MRHEVDILVIGSGVAGLFFALKAAELGRVALVTKAELGESNSRYAQGGIAAVWDDADDFDAHIRDTLIAGAGLCRVDAVQQTVTHGPDAIRELINIGARFTRREGRPEEYSLHREGGHSRRRILHADDLTGAELVRALLAAVREHPNVTLFEEYIAVDLVTDAFLARQAQVPEPEEQGVRGAYILNMRTSEVEVFSSRYTVLATGGAGKIYKYTTNPRVATGDGVAMAWRAGAQVANMEFVQFHPTCLYHAQSDGFLISEALRGEGGLLIHADGTRFMPDYDEREELAPRDVVARAIDAELKRLGLDCVFLDMRHFTADAFQTKFPNIYEKLRSIGLDPSADPIPVVPAAHYFCGGVRTDLNGRTGIARLYAVGETACTGLHGANRLASNSLLEAVVFADAAAKDIATHFSPDDPLVELPAWESASVADSDELVVVQQVWGEIRRFMWNYVGIVRTHRRLKRARRRIQLVQDEIDAYYWDFRVTADLIELRNLATVADLVVRCALRRRESRGLHYTLDFPDSDSRFVRDTVIQRWI